MKLNCETILDFYTHKNRKVLCQIKVNPKSRKFKNTCRCLSRENWKAFDKELEKLITTKIDDLNNEKCLKFVLEPYVQVEVKKSNLTLKQFYKCFGAISGCDIDDDVDATFVLECLLNFQLDVPFSSSPESLEYLSYSSRSPLSYVPYTELGKQYENNEINTAETMDSDFLGYNEDTGSPKLMVKVEVTESLITSSDDGTKHEIKSLEEEIQNSKDTSKSRHANLHHDALDKKEHLLVRSPRNAKSSKSEFHINCRKLESQEHCVTNEKRDKNVLQTDDLKKERSKSEDKFSGSCYEISKEKYTSEKKKHSHSHSTAIKPRSKTLDDIPGEVSVNIKEPKTKNTIKIRDNNFHGIDKVSLHKSKKIEDLKECTVIEKNTVSIKRSERSLSEDELKIQLKKKSKKSPFPRSDNEFEDGNELDINIALQNCKEKVINIKSSLYFKTKSTTETDTKARTGKETKLLRRSGRSPSKPKRFVEEQQNVLSRKKCQKHKTSPNHKELFGTEDEDDNYFESNISETHNNDIKIKASIFETPASKQPVQYSSSSSSTKKRRKIDKGNSECDQEKRDMSKWLSKKKLLPSDKETKKISKPPNKTALFKALPLKTSTKMKSEKVDNNSASCSKSSMPTPMSLELPSKEELELIKSKTKLIQTENAIVRAELDKMRLSPPKEVAILSLQNIPVDDILDTFLTYKSELDQIYEDNRKKDYIKGHAGINHCFVIKLLKQNIQMKMLEKLTDVYSNSKTSTQATLFANALLPEWIIRVYMNKFNFTRQQAIDQIKAQEEFQLHMDDQSNSFMFD